MQTVYTIKQAAARSGVSIPTIRAWERRYGAIQPSRTTAGYRLYDDESVDRLIAMRQLVEHEGWRPSQAAERVRAGGPEVDEIVRRVADQGAAGRSIAGEPGRPDDAAVDAFRAAARRLDVQGMEQVLDEGFASQRFESAMAAMVFPALRAIGDDWSTGLLDVGAEHAASETVRRRLARFYDATGESSGPKVVVGLPPGSHHELGAFAFAVAGRRAGLNILYLGTNVPIQSWLRTVRETAAPVAVLGVVTASDLDAARPVIESLATLPAAPRCLVGGPPAREASGVAGATWLPDSLAAAVTVVLDSVGRPARG